MSKIKIEFISTINHDNYIFEKIYEEVYKQGFGNGQISYNEPEQTYWQEIYYKNFKEVKAYVS